MTTSTASAFFASLAVFSQVLVVGLVGLWLTARFSEAAARALDRVRSELAFSGQWFAAAIAITAMVGSLYYSEVAGFPPCRFCWFQRIAMYPLAVILPIAAARRDVAVRIYAIPLAAIGAALSTYHVLIERYPQLETGSCDPSNPCSLVWVRQWGYLTIPTMALSGFLAIIVVLALVPSTPKEADE
jgi:disulfide bond formation protein DsbB